MEFPYGIYCYFIASEAQTRLDTDDEELFWLKNQNFMVGIGTARIYL